MDPTENLPDLDLETAPKAEHVASEDDDEYIVYNSPEGRNTPTEDLNSHHKKRYSSPLQKQRKRQKVHYSPKNLSKRICDYLTNWRVHPLDD